MAAPTGLAFALFGCGSSVDVDSLFANVDSGPTVPSESNDGNAVRGDEQAVIDEPPDASDPGAPGGAAGSPWPDGSTAGAAAGQARLPEVGQEGDEVDAAADPEASPDVAPIPALDAGDASMPMIIRCGAELCDVATELCCTEAGKTRCLKKNQAASCPKFVTRLACDDRTDCAPGRVCCLSYLAAENRDDGACSTTCAGLPLCDPARAGQCSGTTTCTGSSVLASYMYCR